MSRPSFSFHDEWRSVISGLPNDVRLEVYDAVIEYGLSGTLPTLRPMAMLAFNFVKIAIDADNAKSDEIRRKRAEAGKRGGAPKGNSNASKQAKTSKNKQNKQMVVLDEKDPIETEEVDFSKVLPTKAFQEENKQNKQNKQMVVLTEKQVLKEEKELFPLITPIEEKKENTNTQKRVCARRTFVKPTVDEVRAYINEKGYNIDPDVFWNFYEANGWVQGRQQKPIKNWKACVVTWLRNPQYSRNYATTQTAQRAYQSSEHPTDSELREQSCRIISRLEAERHARNEAFRQRPDVQDDSQS